MKDKVIVIGSFENKLDYVKNHLISPESSIVELDYLSISDVKNWFKLSNMDSLDGKQIVFVIEIIKPTSNSTITKFVEYCKNPVFILINSISDIPKEVVKMCERKILGTVDTRTLFQILDDLVTNKSRKEVFEEIKDVHIKIVLDYLGASWQEFRNPEKVFSVLSFIYRYLYKVDEKLLYAYLVESMHNQGKISFSYPKKKNKRLDIVKHKVAKYFRWSIRETERNWWLIEMLLDEVFMDKMYFTDEEKKLVGLSGKDTKRFINESKFKDLSKY